MSAEGIRVGDVGTIIRRTIMDGGEPVDISGAEVNLVVIRPDRSVAVRKMTIVDGPGGVAEYKVRRDDNMWPVAGLYSTQCIVRWSDADDYASTVEQFYVRTRYSAST